MDTQRISQRIPNTCPKCHTPIPADAPEGLCPACILSGVANGTDAEQKPGARHSVPTLESVAAAFPHLTIIELIGFGGMGVVYKARQPHLDRTVALKILPKTLATDPAFVERFQREARFLARLNHPNIVSVYDFGESAGFCFLIMEYVDGVNLRTAMQTGRFSSKEALSLVPKICEALQFAHDNGVLHRDIKPENILLDSQGRVKLADFGIAKLMGVSEGQPREATLTEDGSRLGTAHYMAPEQIEHPSEVDHRADIYSLGVIFYELLTGELPLGRFASPSAKNDVDARVDAIVLRALAKERELRQQSASEVKTQVECLGTSHRSPLNQPQAAPKVPRPSLPVWARRLAWVFLGCVFVEWVTTFLEFSPTSILIFAQILHPGTEPFWGLTQIEESAVTNWYWSGTWEWSLLLLPTCVALWSRRSEWQRISVLSSVGSLVMTTGTLVFALGMGDIKFIGGYPGLFGVLLSGVASVTSLWLLLKSDVRAALATQELGPDDIAPNPWPNRLLWLCISAVVVPGTFAMLGLVIPVWMGPGRFGMLAVGTVILLTLGGVFSLIGFGMRRTAPGLHEAKPRLLWNPWPKRVFYLIGIGLSIPVLLLAVGIVFPQLVRVSPSNGGREPEIGWIPANAKPIKVEVLHPIYGSTDDPIIAVHILASQPADLRLIWGQNQITAPLKVLNPNALFSTDFHLTKRMIGQKRWTLVGQIGDSTNSCLEMESRHAPVPNARPWLGTAADVKLEWNTPVAIACLDGEPVYLELQSHMTPHGLIDGLPQTLPLPNATRRSSEAMKLADQWHAIRQEYEKLLLQVDLGSIAHDNPLLMSIRRDLAVTEANYRQLPWDAALAQLAYAKAWLHIRENQNEMGIAPLDDVESAKAEVDRIHAELFNRRWQRWWPTE